MLTQSTFQWILQIAIGLVNHYTSDIDTITTKIKLKNDIFFLLNKRLDLIQHEERLHFIYSSNSVVQLSSNNYDVLSSYKIAVRTLMVIVEVIIISHLGITKTLLSVISI